MKGNKKNWGILEEGNDVRGVGNMMDSEGRGNRGREEEEVGEIRGRRGCDGK